MIYPAESQSRPQASLPCTGGLRARQHYGTTYRESFVRSLHDAIVRRRRTASIVRQALARGALDTQPSASAGAAPTDSCAHSQQRPDNALQPTQPPRQLRILDTKPPRTPARFRKAQQEARRLFRERLLHIERRLAMSCGKDTTKDLDTQCQHTREE